MFIERCFVEGLAHASYLFGAGGEAAVVDPKRDVDDYLAAAARHGARITAIFETHPHADFVSGHVELAQRTGAPIYVSHRVAASYPHRPLRHGEEVWIGPVRITALETPGHSPDSMSFFAEDRTPHSTQMRRLVGGPTPCGHERVVFTGDVLFVGDVGRPDLRDADADPRVMANALYDTLHEVLYRLPEETVVYPAHGAGSLCGRRSNTPLGAMTAPRGGPYPIPQQRLLGGGPYPIKIGSAPTTTIGAEKRGNWANQFRTREAFVEAMVSNLPDRPAYFSHDVRMNLAGARPLEEVPRPRPLHPAALHEAHAGALVLDTREPEAYGAAHIANSLNAGVALPVFSTWVGFFVEPDWPVVLVVDRAEDADRAWLELARIGYENIAGYVTADPEAWRAAGLEVRSTRPMKVCCLESWLREGGRLLDVRTAAEWEEGHLDAATWIPLPALPARLGEVPPGPLPILCGTGYRSSLAASLLERAGRTDVANVRGGWSAWIKRQCAEPDALDLTSSMSLR